VSAACARASSADGQPESFPGAGRSAQTDALGPGTTHSEILEGLPNACRSRAVAAGRRSFELAPTPQLVVRLADNAFIDGVVRFSAVSIRSRHRKW
jgi:hypothetical protein